VIKSFLEIIDDGDNDGVDDDDDDVEEIRLFCTRQVVVTTTRVVAATILLCVPVYDNSRYSDVRKGRRWNFPDLPRQESHY
jgi:hypothetical protein